VLSVVVPTLNAEATLEAALAPLANGLAALGEIVIVDGGSSDRTVEIAEKAGARVVRGTRGRGQQLAAGARAARGEWLLFLHADTSLEVGWADAVSDFTAAQENHHRAAVFRFVLDDPSPAARRIERWVAWRARALGLPYGDQGLLISRALYDAVGGFREIALMEDVEIVRRIGRKRLVHLPVAARTSARRYARVGYTRRGAQNLLCLGLHFLGVKPEILARFYEA